MLPATTRGSSLEGRRRKRRAVGEVLWLGGDVDSLVIVAVDIGRGQAPRSIGMVKVDRGGWRGTGCYSDVERHHQDKEGGDSATVAAERSE